MTALVDLCNRALQVIGTRTTVTSAELLANSSNEAIQFNLLATPYRRQLLRMAPWDCSLRTANLTYITSSPGTPENTSGATNLWQPGQPRPPWAYEYQWPVDCVRDCWIIPATQTGFAGGIPVTTAVTGGAPSFWQSMPTLLPQQLLPPAELAMPSVILSLLPRLLRALPRSVPLPFSKSSQPLAV